MRRRLTIAILGTVVAALVLAGLGTLVLARFGARNATRDDLAREASALTQVFEEVDISRLLRTTDPTPTPGSTSTTTPTPRLGVAEIRARLGAISKRLGLEGVGIVFTNAAYDTVVAGEMPPNLNFDDVRLASYNETSVATGAKGDLVWSAARGTSRLNLHFVLVLTSKPTSIVAPASRWFFLASIGVGLLGAFVSLRLARSFTTPVIDASNAAHRMAAGDLGVRVPEPRHHEHDELAELSRSINTMAENLERSRGHERQFLMSVSHDLRTPMTAIQGYAEALADGAVEPAQAAEVIGAQAKRLDRLVADLLLLARLEGQSFTLDVRPTDVAGATREFAQAFTPRAASLGVALAVDAPAPLVALVDPDRLGQVVANLVENALKFARSRVDVRVAPVEGWVELAVADDGPGIAPEDLPHVFERLYVAKHRPTPKESGSGLGLAIVRDLTTAMGGHVAARSPRRDGRAGTEMLVALRPA